MYSIFIQFLFNFYFIFYFIFYFLPWLLKNIDLTKLDLKQTGKLWRVVFKWVHYPNILDLHEICNTKNKQQQQQQ